jgi:hypothetical protein
MSRLTAVIVLLGGLLCFSGGCAKSPPTVLVKAFVVTKGRENIKLALTDVFFEPLSDVQATVDGLISRDRTALDSSAAKLNESTAAINAIAKEMQAAGADKYKLTASCNEASVAASDRANELNKEYSRLSEEEAVTRKDLLPLVERACSQYSSLGLVLEDEALLDTAVKATAFGSEGDLTALATGFSGDHWAVCPQEREAVLALIKKLLAKKKWSLRVFEQNKREIDALNAKVAEHRERFMAADKKARRLSDDAKVLQHKHDVLMKAHSELSNPRRIVDALPAAVQSVQTDADGAAKCKLKKSGDWVLWAKSERLLPDGSVEQYTWLLQVPPSDTSEIEVMLTNDNQLNAGPLPRWLSR